MNNPKVTIFGVPLDCMTLPELIQSVWRMIGKYEKDRKLQWIGTITAELIADTLNWRSYSIRYPELLKSIRSCSVAIPSDSLLLSLSGLMRSDFDEVIAGGGLFFQLAKEAENRQLSVFLLGQSLADVRGAAANLQKCSPRLKIAGISSCRLYMDGIDLENAPERDLLLVEEINKAAPDLLFLSLESPKQEIWIHRVEGSLRVPVVITLQGWPLLPQTPLKKQPMPVIKPFSKPLLPSISDAGEGKGRTLFNLSKFCLQSSGLVLFHTLSYYAEKAASAYIKTQKRKQLQLFLSSEQTLTLVPLPSNFDGLAAAGGGRLMEEIFLQDAAVLDFQEVRHITLEGLSLLATLCCKASQKKYDLFALNINPSMRFFLKMHRIWDLVSHVYVENTQVVLNRIAYSSTQSSFFHSIEQTREEVSISFFGSLAQAVDFEKYLEQLAPVVSGKSCLVDLKYCNEIESSGFSFLLKLRHMMAKEGGRVSIEGVNSNMKTLFRLHKLLKLLDT